MKNILLILAVCLMLVPLKSAAQRFTPTPQIERKIDSLLALMTPEEKAGQLLQFSGDFETGPGGNFIHTNHADLARNSRVGSFLNVHGSEIVRKIQRIAVEESRLHIPLIFGMDVIHGYRTTFPIPLAEACTWDPSAVEQSARVQAREATAAGVQWTFNPMVDIARDPRWGRIAEGSGEDPVIGSAMAVARVKGYQGTSLADPTSMVACVKHFGAYGAAEGGRDYNTVDLSDRSLRETYLVPYQAAVDAGAGTVMCSFNEINGVPSSVNRWLLTDLLKKEWKFDGFVVSDWGSIRECIDHRIAPTLEGVGRKAIAAGLDMDMESNAYALLPRMIAEGSVSAAAVDESVRRVLRLKFALGLFDDPYRGCSIEREKKEILSAENRAIARDVARKSIVLLKNEQHVLPLDAKHDQSIAVIGPLGADKDNLLGMWSGLGAAEDVVSVMDGLKSAASRGSQIAYVKGCAIDSIDKSGFAAAVDAARNADVVILVVGESREMSGEASCRASLDLPGVQQELVEAVAAAGKPTVLVLMNGRPLSIGKAAACVSAVVETWHLGVEAGHAIADVLFGAYNPSGKLTATFPRAVGQVPIFYNYKSTGRPFNDSTHYTTRYLDLSSTPLYPFGYGLSYTTFSYGTPALSSPKIRATESVTVSVDVKNSGALAGEEVVQCYLRDDYACVTRPVKELRAFQKILFQPNETKTVKFTITPEMMSMYDLEMHKVVEPGTFTVFVGTNSADCKQARFEVVE
ncbi:MAG TPA: glycoside hydrolase family 3 N-terminal domain-containing protein [Bacteroidota bacterium]|nr:glycoside hydrolase family 3 N-terminal domain-containing protein [Bacteroidota bacterium]